MSSTRRRTGPPSLLSPPQLRAATTGGRRVRHRPVRHDPRSAGLSRHRRGPRRHRPARLRHRRPSRRGLPRGARPGALGAAEQRRRVAVDEADHRQSRTAASSQDGVGSRPGDRRRHAGRLRAGSAGGGSGLGVRGRARARRLDPVRAGCGTDGRRVRCRRRRRSGRQRRRGAGRGARRCAVRRPAQRADRGAVRSGAVARRRTAGSGRSTTHRSPTSPRFAGNRWPAWRSRSSAAGGHHVLFVGPPGAGKTMLAQRLPGLLPPLERTLSLEATMVHSAAGVPLPPGGLVRRATFRSPHHTSSVVAARRRRFERVATGRDQPRSRGRAVHGRAR